MLLTINEIKAKVAELGIEQVELAKRADKAPSYISRLFLGLIKSPGQGMLQRLTDAVLEIEAERKGKAV
jgi:predicted transcriptional regulator